MGNYTINGVKNCSKTKGPLRLLLVMIADAIPDNTGYYTLSTQALAAYCNYEERFTRRLLTRLVPTGELIKVTRPGKKVVYMIPILEGEPGYDPQPCDSTVHECTGFHTPLDRTRDDLYRAFYNVKKTLDKTRYDRTGGTQKDPGTIIPPTPVSSYPPPRYDDTGDPGTIDPPYPIRTQSDKPKNNPKGASPAFQSRKAEKSAEHSPHSEHVPSTSGALALDTAHVVTPPTPPIAPAPPSPAGAGAELGEEQFLTWCRVLELEKAHFSPVQIASWLKPLSLHKRPDGGYNVRCHTSMQAEMFNTRFFGQVKMDLATVIRAHAELETVVLP